MNFHSMSQKNLFEGYIAPPPMISRCYTTKANAFTNLRGNPFYLGNMRHFNKKNAPFGPGHLRMPPLENRTDFCDPLVKIVGGFVGSKSQAGTTTHRGREFSLWDVIVDKIIDTMENPELRQQAGRKSDGKKNGKIHKIEGFTMIEVGQYPDCATGANFIDKIIRTIENPEPRQSASHTSGHNAKKNCKTHQVESVTMVEMGQYGPERTTGPNFDCLVNDWCPPNPELVGPLCVQNGFPELGVFHTPNLLSNYPETGFQPNSDPQTVEFICKTETATFCQGVERQVDVENPACQDEQPILEQIASSRISRTPSDCSQDNEVGSGDNQDRPLPCSYEQPESSEKIAQSSGHCPNPPTKLPFPESVSSCTGASKHILSPEAAEFTPRSYCPSRPSLESESDDSIPADVSSSVDQLSSSCESRSPIDTFRRAKVQRTLSECSVDSDDSFIVFESEEDDPVILSEDSDCEDCSDEDFDEIDNPILVPHNLDFSQPPPVLSRLEEANKKWAENYSDVKLKASDSAVKKVKFAEGNNLVKVKHLVAWDFAHRAARIGPWEMYHRDGERFKSRISSLSSVLSPVLAKRHREKIYSERFQT